MPDAFYVRMGSVMTTGTDRSTVKQAVWLANLIHAPESGPIQMQTA
jgi:hypothetical protein